MRNLLFVSGVVIVVTLGSQSNVATAASSIPTRKTQTQPTGEKSLLLRRTAESSSSGSNSDSETSVGKEKVMSGDGTLTLNFDRIKPESKHVHIGVGDKLKINLWGNPVTGDGWHLALNPAPCLNGSKTVYRSDDPQEPALGGVWIYSFDSNHCCERDLAFYYGKDFAFRQGDDVGRDDSDSNYSLETKVSVSIKVAPSLKSMSYKDGCSLKVKEMEEDDSWFV